MPYDLGVRGIVCGETIPSSRRLESSTSDHTARNNIQKHFINIFLYIYEAFVGSQRNASLNHRHSGVNSPESN